MERVADAVAAAGCVFLAYWSWRFVAGSFADHSRGQALEILLWPIQSVLVWCFASSALRYAAHALWPALRGAREVR
jgi:TRAP-type C4-dicarboxylate transport system permease small subunit